MNKIDKLLQTLPPHMVACLESPEYANIFEALSEKYDLTDEQKDTMEDIVIDVFLKTLSPSDVGGNVGRLFGFDTEKTRAFARDIIGEFAVPFSDYFPDCVDALRALGGNEADVLAQSAMIQALTRIAREGLIAQAQALAAMDMSQGRVQFSRIIENHLIDYLYGADDVSKEVLNDLAVHFFTNAQNYPAEFLRALLESKQTIGQGIHIERDGKTYPLQTGQWLKDFISFSAGDPSTMHIAQYLTQNKNARLLPESDKSVLQNILEMYRIAKFFPESLRYIPEDQWMIIPYTAEQPALQPSSQPSPDEEQPLGAPPSGMPPQPPMLPEQQESASHESEHIPETGAASAASLLPPQLAIPELQAPDASLHALAPVVVQARQAANEPELSTEEFHDEFFLEPEEQMVILQARTVPGEKGGVRGAVPGVSEEKKALFSGTSYQSLADEVLAMSGVPIADQALRARLQNVVITRLKNIRTSIEMRERLADPAQRGGFGLDTKTADSIMRSANMATDLLSQGALMMSDVQQEQPSIESDVREIQQLVKRKFAMETQKIGRTRSAHHEQPIHRETPPQPVRLPELPEIAPLAGLPIVLKKPPAPPPPPPKAVVLSEFAPVAELETLPISLPQKEMEMMRVSQPQIQPQKAMPPPPVKLKERWVAAVPALDLLRFRKALKPISATFAKKLSVQQVAQGTQGVSHVRPRSFFGATDMPHVQHTGLPALSIEEVDGVPMIIERQTEEEKNRKQAEERKAIEEVQRAKKLEEEKRVLEQKMKEQVEQERVAREEAKKIEKQKKEKEEQAHREIQQTKNTEEEQRLREEAQRAQKIAEEAAAQIAALKEEMRKKEEAEKIRKQTEEQKLREEAARVKKLEEEKQVLEKKMKEQGMRDEERKKIAQAAKKLEEEKKALEQATKEQTAPPPAQVVAAPKAVGEPQKPVEIAKPAEAMPIAAAQPEQAPATGAMPQNQPTGGSFFSNIFHIPVSVKTAQQPGKVSFVDIKTAPRLVDTIEELRIFTLKDFRRLSEDPLNAASRIYDKIQAMERESFTKKLAAIQAWRENEINALYVQIGQEALLKGKSITSVIEQLKSEGRPYLTEQEFDAILELNERVRM